MKQAHKKRSHKATANSPPVLADMGKLLYKSGKFINQILCPYKSIIQTTPPLNKNNYSISFNMLTNTNGSLNSSLLLMYLDCI